MPSARVTNPLLGEPARSPWRLIAAAAAVSTAVAHLPILQAHLSEAPYIGIGFLLLIIAGLLLSQLLLRSDTPAVWTATLVVSALALGAFVASRTLGLPLIGDDVGNWADPLAIVALASEATMVATALLYLGARRTATPSPHAGTPSGVGAR